MSQLNQLNLNPDQFRVIVFGSARINPEDSLYKEIYKIGRAVGSMGADIVTGGGPGLMEAANKGHFEATPDPDNKAQSIGIRIQLPFEEKSNPNLDVKIDFKKFSNRLDAFMNASDIVIVAPGGVGTLLELSFVWQLVQVGHVKPMPVVLIGDQWKNFKEWAKENLIKPGFADEKDLDFLICVDSAEEAIEEIKKICKKCKL